MHNEEVNELLLTIYYLGDQIKKNEKPEGKRPLGKSRHKLEDNIKIDLQEVEWEGMDWIDLGQNRDSKDSTEPSSSIKCG